MAESVVVHVEVAGQRYPIKTTLEPAYVQKLAAYVDTKMGLAVEASPSSDTLGLAVMTALNIADEYFRAHRDQLDRMGGLSERAAALERLVDQAIQAASRELPPTSSIDAPSGRR